jgi:hypothetical protein
VGKPIPALRKGRDWPACRLRSSVVGEVDCGRYRAERPQRMPTSKAADEFGDSELHGRTGKTDGQSPDTSRSGGAGKPPVLRTPLTFARYAIAIAAVLSGLALGTWVENSSMLAATASLAKNPLQRPVKLIYATPYLDSIAEWKAVPVAVRDRLLAALSARHREPRPGGVEATVMLKILFSGGGYAFLPVTLGRDKLYVGDYGAGWGLSEPDWRYPVHTFIVPFGPPSRDESKWLRRAGLISRR